MSFWLYKKYIIWFLSDFWEKTWQGGLCSLFCLINTHPPGYVCVLGGACLTLQLDLSTNENKDAKQ